MMTSSKLFLSLLLLGICLLVFFATSVTGCAIQSGSLVVFTTPSPPTNRGVGGNCFAGVGPPHTSCLSNNPDKFVSFPGINSEDIVSQHNVLRSGVNPRAKDMGLLQWNYLMAFLARRWAAQCGNYSERITYRSVPGVWDYVGQNVFTDLGSSDVNFGNAITQWANEKDTGPFKYGDLGLTDQRVGRYTQIIWAKTQIVGCAAAVCQNPTAVFYVCNYAPSGNLAIDGRHPFAFPYTASDLTTVAG